MGNLTSSIHTDNHLKEILMISYMNRNGPTPHNWDLIPGGSLKETDDDAVVRHKFKMALKKQQMLNQTLYGIDRKVTRCLSPCLLTDFSLEGKMEGGRGNLYAYKWNDGEGDEEKFKGKAKVRASSGKGKGDSGGLGSLDKLVSAIYPQVESREEIVAYDVKQPQQHHQQQPLRGSLKEKRTRSRPERTSRAAADQRQVLSVTEVRHEVLNPIQETFSEVIVEKIELGGKRSRKCWPPKELLNSVMKDSKNRPENFFLARFRSPHLPGHVEVEYRFHRQTSEESFTYKGDLELLLPEECRRKYEVDKFNNNLDEKSIFFENLPFFVNNYNVRIFWNGFLMVSEGPVSERMTLQSVLMDPPTLLFDMSGINRVSATRNHSKLNITGNTEEGDGACKSFAIRGRSENDVKAVDIKHTRGTTMVSVVLPMLSSSGNASGVSRNASGKPSAVQI